MADTILLLNQIENLFRTVTNMALSIKSTDSNYHTAVRIAFQQTGAPAWKITEDVVFLIINNPDEDITRQRDVTYETMLTDDVNKLTSYTRVHNVRWVIYGPHSYDNAEKIKNGLYRSDIKETLAKNNLYLVLDVVPPVRSPETFNGQWWERSNFNARFNEKVNVNNSVPAVSGVQVIVRKD